MINLPRTPRPLLSFCLACTLSAAAPIASSQTLARPGWVGSGITTDLWWKRAIIYEINPADFSPAGDNPLHGIAHRLDYIHSLGTDAILLTHLQPDPAHAETIDPTLGSLDEFDDLLREASSRHLRVLLDLDPAIPADDLPNVARFWLNRGVAGFHISGTSEAAREQAATLRTTTASYLGQRILIVDADPNLTATAQPQPQPQPATRGRHHAHSRSRRQSHATTQNSTALDTQSPQLLLDDRLGAITPLNAAAIRPIIDRLQDIQQAGHSLPLLATDGPAFTRSMSRYADGQHDLAIAKLLATLLFTTRAESLLYYGQELGVRASSSSDTAIPLILWDAPPPEKPAPVTETYVPYKPTTSETYVPYKPPTSETHVPYKPPTTTTSAPLDATPNAALEDADPNSLLNWYRQLSALHHGNSTLALGTSFTINRDDQNVLVLVRRPKVVSATSPVMVLLFNLTAQPVHLSLKDDTTKLGLRGSFLRTVLRTDDSIGTMHLEEMTLAPYVAYIGELRY
ncbi:alpha-amylase family glycosyl hydrolase [Tunturibacter empetritectus]|uniref:Alpha-glucosidase n=1 Tax=Tunturiibacter empetritectus TaxID=3069691 RepID=A0A7W8ILK3_9BACT|nr:alpha-amylase family glycosyl hydrolase [Edaphobacter lichenicola]MBB5318675.1 alpha-glucosidase [Edaphobacter lichenicola]